MGRVVGPVIPMMVFQGAAQVPAKEFFYFWRDSGPTFTWNGPYSLPITPAQGVTANPVLIQSRFATQGNFELVTPVFGGGLAHLWRNNDDLHYPWSEPTLLRLAYAFEQATLARRMPPGVPPLSACAR